MIAALVVTLALGIDFAPQELPGLQVGPVKGQSGRHDVNFRHADLDGDGSTDLVFADTVWLQRGGVYPTSHRLKVPFEDDAVWVDIWRDQLYCWSATRLQVFTLAGTVWETALEVPLERPVDRDTFTGDIRLTRGWRAAKLHRFAVPAKSGPAPDLVALSEAGLHRFHREGDGYGEPHVWDVLPPLRLTAPRTFPVWPPAERRFVFPAQQMDCRLVLEGNAVRVVTREAVQDQQAQFEVRSFALDDDQAFAPEITVTSTVPRHVQPTRLNDDNVLDLAGTRWDLAGGSTWPVPVCETWASLDGGKTFAVRRAPSLQRARPVASFVDFDADGDMDMVTESTALFDGGAREALNQMLSRRAVDHVVRVYRQRDGAFESTPWIETRKTIAIDAPPLRGSPRLSRYNSAKLVDLTGDFNGDNRLDLVISEETGKISIYLLEGAGYPARPAASRDYDEAHAFAALDVNGDGRSDLVFRPPVPEASPVVWFTTGERP